MKYKNKFTERSSGVVQFTAGYTCRLHHRCFAPLPCGVTCRKDLLVAQREYKKKKNEKKRLRIKQLEEQKEKEKNQWLAFNAKVVLLSRMLPLPMNRRLSP